MAIIKVTDLAYGRLRAPDLDAAEEFLTNFGMVRSERTPSALYMRGTDPTHHIHVTEKGEPKFLGFAYYAASEDDLKRLAKTPGASGIESIDEPGGGKRARLTEPNGYQIEVVHGIAPVNPIATKRQKLNTGLEPLSRAGELMRLPKGPSHVKRIGHGVLMTPKFRETVAWFRETLGFICSDDVYAGAKDNLIGSFNRSLRLLGGPVGPRARALGGQRPAQSRQRLQPGAGGGGAHLAMGRGPAGKIHQPRQRVNCPPSAEERPKGRLEACGRRHSLRCLASQRS